MPGQSTARQDSSTAMNPQTDFVFLTRDGCVNTTTMRANFDRALRSLGLATTYEVIDLGTSAVTDPRGGYGTPTVLYRNRDLFGMAEPPPPHPAAT
jgi:hypothetical protein